MVNSASHDSVSRIVADRPMCLATALDKAFENIDCMSAILRCQAKNRFYESTQRLIQPRRVLWTGSADDAFGSAANVSDLSCVMFLLHRFVDLGAIVASECRFSYRKDFGTLLRPRSAEFLLAWSQLQYRAQEISR